MAQEESKTNCHQCWSTTPDATSAAQMPGEVNLSLCKRGQIPHSTNKEKGRCQGTITSAHHTQILQRTLHAQLTACCSPITSHSVLWQPFQDGRSAQTLQQWATTMAAVQCLPSVLHFLTKKVQCQVAAHCNQHVEQISNIELFLSRSLKQRPRCMRSCVPCSQKLTPWGHPTNKGLSSTSCTLRDPPSASLKKQRVERHSNKPHVECTCRSP